MQTEAVPLSIQTTETRTSSQVVEPQLVRIWCDVIRVDTIQPSDDLFDLGGHSLLVAQIVSRVRQDLGVAITMRQVFDNPRFGDFAALVSRTVNAKVVEAPAVAAA